MQESPIVNYNVNGLRIVHVPTTSELATVGIAFLGGSNFETPEVAGISHFIEHMCFKGTSTRTWRDITLDTAEIGGLCNAYTSNTEVFYHITCPRTNVKKAVNLILDIFFNSTFPEEEVEKERNVIKEEKIMYCDDPKESFEEQSTERLLCWEKGHGIIGTYETIASINREQMMQYLKARCNISNVVLVVSSAWFDFEACKKFIEHSIPSDHAYFEPGPLNKVSDEFWGDLSTINVNDKISVLIDRENIMQSSVRMFARGPSAANPDFAAQTIANRAVGNSMYSKLFIKIREELGLCYSVGTYTHPIAYPDYTINVLFGYTSPQNVDAFITESEKVIADTLKNGIDEKLFNCAKETYLSSYLSMAEDVNSRAVIVARDTLIDRQRNIRDIINKIRGVTIEDCNKALDIMFPKEYYWAVMNPKR